MNFYKYLVSILFLNCGLSDMEIKGNFRECTIKSFNHQLVMDDQCNVTLHTSLLGKGVRAKTKDYDNVMAGIKPFRSNNTYSIFDKQVGKSYANPDYYFKFWVMSKREFYLDELGHECKILKHEVTYSKDVFFNPYTEIVSTYERLTKYQCLAMISDRLCFGNKMNCHNKNECKFKSKMEADFPNWFGHIKRTYYDCEFRARPVTARINQTRVVDEAIEPCAVADGHCNLENSILIWYNTGNKCQYERVLFIDDAYLNEDDTCTFFTLSHRYLFQLESKITDSICDLNLHKTYEGVYLVFLSPKDTMGVTNAKVSKLPQSKYSISNFASKLNLEMSLSENDFNQLFAQKEIFDVSCSLLVNTIRSNLDNDDTFVSINFPGNKDILIYIHNGLIYLPACSNVTNITVVTTPTIDNRGFCSDNFEVKYNVNNVEKVGYLRNQKIITQYSSRSKCEDVKNQDLIVSDIRFKRSRTSPFNINATHYSPIITRLNPMDPNLLRLSFHHDMVIDGLEVRNDLDDTIMSSDEDDLQYVPSFIDGIQTPKDESSMSNYIDYTIGNISKSWKYYLKLAIIACIIVLACVMFLPASVGLFFKLVARTITKTLSNISKNLASIRIKYKRQEENGSMEMGDLMNKKKRIIDHV